MSGLETVHQDYAQGSARQLVNMGLPAPFESMECAHASNGMSIIHYLGDYWISLTYDLQAAIEYIKEFGYDGSSLAELMGDIPGWRLSQRGGVKAAVADARKALRLETCVKTIAEIGLQIDPN